MIFLESLKYFMPVLPALVVGGVSWYFLRQFIANEERRRDYLLRKDKQKETTPIRLQAYERMVLFLERMSIDALINRIELSNENPEIYVKNLLRTIDNEYEYNLSQQLYLSEKSWAAIKRAKAQTKMIIKQIFLENKIKNLDDLKKTLLVISSAETTPTEEALKVLKSDVRRNF